MPGWFSLLDDDSSSCDGKRMIEALERRQLLSVSVIDSAVVAPAASARFVEFGGKSFRLARTPLMHVDDVLIGTLVITRASDPAERIDPVREVQLNFTEAEDNGLLRGSLAIEGLGVFEVVGILSPRRRIDLIFTDGLDGFARGRVDRGGSLVNARLTATDGDDVIRGQMQLFGDPSPEFFSLGDQLGFFDDGFIFRSEFFDNDFFFDRRLLASDRLLRASRRAFFDDAIVNRDNLVGVRDPFGGRSLGFFGERSLVQPFGFDPVIDAGLFPIDAGLFRIDAELFSLSPIVAPTGIGSLSGVFLTRRI